MIAFHGCLGIQAVQLQACLNTLICVPTLPVGAVREPWSLISTDRS